MTVVVADTSPLNYLVLIGQINILQVLYGRVLVPPEVLAELADRGAPPEVSDWIRSRPEWLQVRAAHADQSDAALQQIGPGERAAILLAQEASARGSSHCSEPAGGNELPRLAVSNRGTGR